MFVEQTYTVDTREIDHQGHCRPSAVLGFLQETATAAAGELGFSRETMVEKYNSFWMLARIWVELDRPLLWDERVSVRTWHRPPRGATVYRDFDLFAGGLPVGQAVSNWVLANMDTHRLLRVDKVAEMRDTFGGPGLEKSLTLSHIAMPENLIQTERRRLHYSEQDLNGHVNNTRYADFACDALRLETLADGAFVSELRLGFLAECRAGDELDLWTGREGETGFVRGMGRDGKPRFEAAAAVREKTS